MGVFVITVDGEVVGGANLGFYEHDIAEVLLLPRRS